jgi:hypothetical protein
MSSPSTTAPTNRSVSNRAFRALSSAADHGADATNPGISLVAILPGAFGVVYYSPTNTDR